MDSERTVIIKELIEKKTCMTKILYHTLMSSVLNTIDIFSLIDYVIYEDCNSCMYNSVVSNVENRLELRHNINYNDVFDYLLEKLCDANYYKRQRIKKLLLVIVKYMDRDYIYAFFDLFYKSKYKYEVRAAMSISKYIWDDSFNKIAIECYLEYKDDYLLEIFMKNGNVECLSKYLERVWDVGPTSYLKKNIIEQLCPKYFDQFKFLKDVEPEKYLMAISYSDQKINDDEILECFNKISDDKKHYGLLSLGRIGRWDIVKNEIEKYLQKKNNNALIDNLL